MLIFAVIQIFYSNKVLAQLVKALLLGMYLSRRIELLYLAVLF